MRRSKIFSNFKRYYQSDGRQEAIKDRNRRIGYYCAAAAIGTLGASYAAVPLYKVFCQATGYGGEIKRASVGRLEKLTPVSGCRQISIDFDAGTGRTMPWKFTPAQDHVKVVPGETALAFYTAENPTDKAIIGVATYNVNPMKAGVYFNKIQCFCFEEQRLKPHEIVDMPVFFFLDPEFATDPNMADVNHITLSYTFFKSNQDDDE